MSSLTGTLKQDVAITGVVSPDDVRFSGWEIWSSGWPGDPNYYPETPIMHPGATGCVITFDCPTSLIPITLWLRSVSIAANGDVNRNPIVPGVTPSVQVTLGTTTGTVDLSQALPSSFAAGSPLTGGAGVELDIAVTGAITKIGAQLDVAVTGAITKSGGALNVAPGGITSSYIGSAAVLASNMAANSVTYANAALAANSIVDGNVANVGLWKLQPGTVVFTGDIALARGNGQAVLTMDNTGLYLFSNCTASGSGATPGSGGNPTYSASGLTSTPYVGVTASQIGAFSGGSGPSVTITGSGVNLWSANGSTSSPYGSLTSSGAWFYYDATHYATVQSGGFAAVSGSYSAQVYGTGITVAYA